MANKPSAEELKKNLSEMQFYVTQNHGTEPPFTGRLLHNKRDGVYHCLICDAPLFHSQTKYDSGCGWPSFYEPVSEESIRYIKDLSHGMQRIEIRCGNCDAHLGHVFPDGPQPTGERYCVNSASLRFTDGENGEEIKLSSLCVDDEPMVYSNQAEAAAIENALGQHGEEDIEDSFIITDADGEVANIDDDSLAEDEEVYEDDSDDKYSNFDSDDYDV